MDVVHSLTQGSQLFLELLAPNLSMQHFDEMLRLVHLDFSSKDKVVSIEKYFKSSFQVHRMHNQLATFGSILLLQSGVLHTKILESKYQSFDFPSLHLKVDDSTGTVPYKYSEYVLLQ